MTKGSADAVMIAAQTLAMTPAIQTFIQFIVALLMLIGTRARFWTRSTRGGRIGLTAASLLYAVYLPIFLLSGSMNPTVTSSESLSGLILYLASLALGFTALILSGLAFTIALAKTIRGEKQA